jgi:hypothetical protein
MENGGPSAGRARTSMPPDDLPTVFYPSATSSGAAGARARFFFDPK